MDSQIESFVQSVKEKNARLKELAGRYIRTIEVPNQTSQFDNDDDFPFIVRLLESLLPSGYKIVKVGESDGNQLLSNSVALVKPVINTDILGKVKKISNEWEEFIAPLQKNAKQYVNSLDIAQDVKDEALTYLNTYEIIRYSPLKVSEILDNADTIEEIVKAKDSIISALSKAIDETAQCQISHFEKVSDLISK